MSDAGSIVIGLAAAAAGAFGATKRLHERWRARWRLRNHEPLDEALDGDLVYVCGVVRALDETLVAPLSGRTCVAYRSRVHGRSLDGRSSMNHELMQLRPFALDCDDGTSIVVDGERVMFGVPHQKLSPRDPERENNFRARHAISQGRVRYSEVIVEIGSEVLVGGTLIYVPCDDPPTEELGFRDPPPPEPQIVGNRDEPLVILAHRS